MGKCPFCIRYVASRKGILMKEDRRKIEVAFDASECLYGEFIVTCEKNGLNPAEVLRKLIRHYVITEYIRKKVNKKMVRDSYMSEKYELSWEERWNIIEEMTSNMSADEREEWIEGME